MKATELERLAEELVDNLNHNVVNQVPSDKQVRHDEEFAQRTKRKAATNGHELHERN
jgi:hypothetical protein